MFYIYFLLIFIPFLTSLICLPILIVFAKRKNLFDIPVGDRLKIHKFPTPHIGGWAMIFSLVVGFTFFYLYKGAIDWKIYKIIFAAAVIFSLGLWDDLNWKHYLKNQPVKKLFLLIFCSLAAAAILINAGVKIGFLPGYFFSIILTFVYIFIFINAVNYQDGIDGLAAGLVAISLAGFIILGFVFGNELSLVFSLILLGSILGFLYFNFPPAKIFMGDSGAYFLGFVLVVLTAYYSRAYDALGFAGTIFIFGTPLFDGVFTNVRRLFNGKSILLGGRDHFYDYLFKKSNSQVKTDLISYCFQAISVLIGVTILVLANKYIIK